MLKLAFQVVALAFRLPFEKEKEIFDSWCKGL